MLNLITGPAGAGKTARILNEIKEAVERKDGKRLLIVPEQYSHEAERELCALCGDTLSLYAEVFSFTALSRRVMATVGGVAGAYLDKGGKLLCMALALSAVSTRLQVYHQAYRKPELQAMLIKAVDETKNACISADMLMEAAEKCPGELGRKLKDLALIRESFDAVIANGHADPTDRLTLLAEKIPESFIDRGAYVYIDGFIDFTAQEMRIIEAMLRAGASLTVCLTVDSMAGDNEIFELSRRSARALKAMAAELKIDCRENSSIIESGKQSQLRAYCENMFSYSTVSLENEGKISLNVADSITAECELAAARVIELVRDEGYRYRDIAIAVRGFDSYASTLESIFRHYSLPLFITRRTDIFEKPLPALIGGAYEIINGGWDVDAVTAYMRTGLTGLTRDECDELENYIFKWQIKAAGWLRAGAWKQHPEGYNVGEDEESTARLEHINALREKLSAPLLLLKQLGESAETAAEQARALYAYLEAIELPRLLTERAEALTQNGRESLAKEYLQLWGIICSALEQFNDILGEAPMSFDEFGRMYAMMLSTYDVGTIPVALDRVAAGDFDRMRRRSIKQLIVLGACDSRLPQSESEAGIFSNDERARLLEASIDLGGDEGELWREFSLIYNTLSLPSDGLTMSYATAGDDGKAQRPAFVFSRARALFDIELKKADIFACRIQARAPALSIAAQAFHGGSREERAAAEYFRESEGGQYQRLEAAAKLTRGKLSPIAVERLYGSRLRISASQIDKFASCKFAYFCQYGLKAKPYKPADFKGAEIGSFSHYVLENVARAVKGRGGFAKVDDKEILSITDHYIHEYIHTELNDFREKSSRFEYLFSRLIADMNQIVLDMARELRCSDFEPLEFEFNFGNVQAFPPVELGEGDASLTLTGIADRIDGWLHDGKLYLRVVDYKTGAKSFSLEDVYYGRNLQMLLYLFALEEQGSTHFGHEIVPGGIMYVPARTNLINLTENVSDEEAEKKHDEILRRSGLVLDNAQLREAWEHGDKYIPIKMRYGKPKEDTLASLERFGALSRHISRTLKAMAKELHHGAIATDPFYRSEMENACLYCDYFSVCHFADGENGEQYMVAQKLDAPKLWTLIEGGKEESDNG